LRATAASDGNTILVANQPFGGVARLAECRDRLRKLAADESVAPGLRERIAPDDDAVLADITLNVILRGTGIHVVLPTMIKPAHIANNVAALAHSRFSDEEVAVLRNALANQN
jgi:aryl-alcohol dehydrogenase-like predicted oxidoreductase